jgi:hypothetical protein
MVWDSTIAGASLSVCLFACASFLVAVFAEEVGGSFICLLLPSPPSFAVFGFFFWGVFRVCLHLLCSFHSAFTGGSLAECVRFFTRKGGRKKGEGRRRKVGFRRRIRAHEEEEEEEVGHYTNNVFRGRR